MAIVSKPPPDMMDGCFSAGLDKIDEWRERIKRGGRRKSVDCESCGRNSVVSFGPSCRSDRQTADDTFRVGLNVLVRPAFRKRVFSLKLRPSLSKFLGGLWRTYGQRLLGGPVIDLVKSTNTLVPGLINHHPDRPFSYDPGQKVRWHLFIAFCTARNHETQCS